MLKYGSMHMIYCNEVFLELKAIDLAKASSNDPINPGP
jgi:hypothetical protein